MIYVLLIWNVIVFTIYALDKFFAKRDMWRIKESLLILSAFLLGGVGAIASMVIFRHKTKKFKFIIAIPLSVVFNAVIISLIYNIK